MQESKKIKADTFGNLQIGELFTLGFETDGVITYQKTKSRFAEIVKTEGKYQNHLIGNVKYFYLGNLIFQSLNQ